MISRFSFVVLELVLICLDGIHLSVAQTPAVSTPFPAPPPPVPTSSPPIVTTPLPAPVSTAPDASAVTVPATTSADPETAGAMKAMARFAEKFGASLLDGVFNQQRNSVYRDLLDSQIRYQEQVNPVYAEVLRSIPPETFTSLQSLGAPQPTSGSALLDVLAKNGIGLSIPKPGPKQTKAEKQTDQVTNMLMGLLTNVINRATNAKTQQLKLARQQQLLAADPKELLDKNGGISPEMLEDFSRLPAPAQQLVLAKLGLGSSENSGLEAPIRVSRKETKVKSRKTERIRDDSGQHANSNKRKLTNDEKRAKLRNAAIGRKIVADFMKSERNFHDQQLEKKPVTEASGQHSAEIDEDQFMIIDDSSSNSNSFGGKRRASSRQSEESIEKSKQSHANEEFSSETRRLESRRNSVSRSSIVTSQFPFAKTFGIVPNTQPILGRPGISPITTNPHLPWFNPLGDSVSNSNQPYLTPEQDAMKRAMVELEANKHMKLMEALRQQQINAQAAIKYDPITGGLGTALTNKGLGLQPLRKLSLINSNTRTPRHRVPDHSSRTSGASNSNQLTPFNIPQQIVGHQQFQIPQNQLQLQRLKQIRLQQLIQQNQLKQSQLAKLQHQQYPFNPQQAQAQGQPISKQLTRHNLSPVPQGPQSLTSPDHKPGYHTLAGNTFITNDDTSNGSLNLPFFLGNLGKSEYDTENNSGSLSFPQDWTRGGRLSGSAKLGQQSVGLYQSGLNYGGLNVG